MVSITMIKKIICLGSVLFVSSAYSQVSQGDSTHVTDTHSDTSKTNFNIPIFNTTGADADSDMDQQDVASLLQSSRDVFVQFSSFQFSSARYRMRGYQSENQLILINGINVSNLETGAANFSSWGGLNDVTRFSENRFGNTASRFGFSGAGGFTNMDSKASSFRKGTRISYGNANRAFRNRVMVTHSTGMMQNGWALTLSASSRTGDEVYIPGTYFRANAFYLSLDKRINEKHLISLTSFVAPVEQGRSASEQLEVYELAGTNYYNSLWGYQNGEVRNSSVRKTSRPMVMLSHIYTPSLTSRLTTSVFYNWGKTSQSGLNWNNSPNPRPNYYRYLPSYFYNQGLTAQGDALTSLWQNDVNTRQINWDRLIAMNQANLYTMPSQVGQGLNSNETRARYILEDRVENIKSFGFNTIYNKRIENLFVSAGLNGNIFKNNQYKTLNDLLGATFWLDYDQFASNLGVDAAFQQNDLANPDKKIFKGDKFGYDYNVNINKVQSWGQAEYSIDKFDVYIGAEVATTQVWREGFVANGKFPTDSKGKSDVISYVNYGVKGGVTYKINGRNFLTANGSFLTRPPEVNNMFLSEQTRNEATNGVTSEQVGSYEFSYLAKYPGFKARATYYNTTMNNQSNTRVFWHDLYNNNVNYIVTGLNEKHQGVEIGIEKTLFTSHVIQGAFGYGNYYYTNNAKAQAWQSNNNVELYKDRTVYLKNYRLGGTPQMVSGLGYKYQGKKYWFVSATFNYFGEFYIEPNPDRRTAEALEAYVEGDSKIQDVIGQEKLPDFYTVNANAGKSFRIKGKYFLNFNASVNNILNDKNIIIWGFEQLRWDVGDLTKFPNKYQYMLGTTFMLSATFSF